LENVKQQAKAYAVDQKQTMAVYKEGNEYKYAEAGFAIRSGYYVLEFISQHNGNKP